MLNAFNEKEYIGGGYIVLSDMKKKYIVYLVALCALIVAFVLFKIRNLPTFDPNHIQKITIAVLPSPSKEKHLTRREDIHKFIECYNELDGKPILGSVLKGWRGNIKLDRHTIIINGNHLKVDGFWYALEAKDIEKLIGLYDIFD